MKPRKMKRFVLEGVKEVSVVVLLNFACYPN